MQRREFLTVSAASATIAAASAKAGAAMWQGRETAQFSRARFLAWLNNEFRVAAHGSVRTLAATIVAVKDGPAHPGLEQFSVVFRGAASLPTGLCWLSHADGSQFSLYLDAASGGASGTLRRATFGLLEKQDV